MDLQDCSRQFSLLIKPVSADCNLACSYCFYRSKASLYPASRGHHINARTLERIVASYFATDQACYSFNWQGGEPTILGAGFFHKVVELQNRFARPGARVTNSLQTNGNNISIELAELLSRYNFLVGISLDGPRQAHDRFRINRNGHGTYAKTMEGIERLQKYRVEFNILTAVSSANVEAPHELYRFLADLGVRHQQYVPIVELDQRGQALPYTISSEQWARFLIGLYDSWLPDSENISIRFFDAILHKLILDVPLVCTMSTNCCHYFVVEHNGDIFPCDFFVEKAWKVGNINENNWEQLVDSPLYQSFGRQKTNWNTLCATCAYLALCAGDCLKHRLGNPAFPSSLSWLCSGYRQFFDHALPGFQRLARRIKRRQSRELIYGSAL